MTTSTCLILVLKSAAIGLSYGSSLMRNCRNSTGRELSDSRQIYPVVGSGARRERGQAFQGARTGARRSEDRRFRERGQAFQGARTGVSGSEDRSKRSEDRRFRERGQAFQGGWPITLIGCGLKHDPRILTPVGVKGECMPSQRAAEFGLGRFPGVQHRIFGRQRRCPAGG